MYAHDQIVSPSLVPAYGGKIVSFRGSVSVCVLVQGSAWGSDSLLRQLLCLDVCRTYGWLVGWLEFTLANRMSTYPLNTNTCL